MSFPFQRIAHITLDHQHSSYAMDLIAVYLLLCLVIIVSFFVIPWVDWQRCETLNSYCCRVCCCCCMGSGINGGGGGGASLTAVTTTTCNGDTANGSTPLDIVISVKPAAGKSDAKLSPTPSYSEFAPPDYDEVATTTAAGNGTDRVQSRRPSRTLMAIFVVELPKCARSPSNVPASSTVSVV